MDVARNPFGDRVRPVGCVGSGRVVMGTVARVQPAIEGHRSRMIRRENIAGDALGTEPRRVEVKDHFGRGIVDSLKHAVVFEQAHALLDLVIEAIVQP